MNNKTNIHYRNSLDWQLKDQMEPHSLWLFQTAGKLPLLVSYSCRSTLAPGWMGCYHHGFLSTQSFFLPFFSFTLNILRLCALYKCYITFEYTLKNRSSSNSLSVH